MRHECGSGVVCEVLRMGVQPCALLQQLLVLFSGPEDEGLALVLHFGVFLHQNIWLGIDDCSRSLHCRDSRQGDRLRCGKIVGTGDTNRTVGGRDYV